MNVQELMRSHRYAEAIADLRRDLANNPEDMLAVELMAEALRADGEYEEALSFFKRLESHRKEDKVANALAPGSAPWQMDIACLHWLLEEHATAVRLMHDLAASIIDGSIKYGDAVGGMSQGLLLHYMATTDNIPEEVSFALDYIRNRVKRSYSNIWPCPIAQYYLGDVTFETVMDALNRRPTLFGLDAATLELGRRLDLCVALFHDGIRFRARGNEEHCLARMRECYGLLEYPRNAQEWYLARYEVQKADNR